MRHLPNCPMSSGEFPWMLTVMPLVVSLKSYPLRDSVRDCPYCLCEGGQGAAPLPCAVPRPDTWGTATTACRVPTAALRWPPARALRDSLWTRTGMGGRIASRPLLCYPYLSPGPAALSTIRAPAGGRSTLPLGLHPCVPLGYGQGCPVRATHHHGSRRPAQVRGRADGGDTPQRPACLAPS
jgi:hypothetical protein